jgi:hypothetical protein
MVELPYFTVKARARQGTGRPIQFGYKKKGGIIDVGRFYGSGNILITKQRQ